MITDFLLITVISLFVFLWVGKNFKRVVLFLAFFLPFEEFVLKFMPVSDVIYSLLRYGSEILLLMTLIALIIKKMVEKKPYIKTPVDLPVLIFVGITFLSGLLNQTPLLEIVLFIRILLRYYALYFLLVNIELDEKFTRKLIYGLVSIASFQFFIGLAQVLIGGPVNTLLMPRPSTLIVGSYSKEWVLLQGLREKGYLFFGTFGDTVNLGLFIFVIFIVMLGVYFIWKKPIKKMWLFFLLSFFTLLFTYSVGLIFTLFISLLFITIIKRKWTLMVSSFLIVLLFFLILSFYPAEFAEVATSHYMVSPLRNLSATFSTTFLESIQQNRLFTLIEVPKVILSQSPLFGFGPGWGLIKDRVSSHWLGDVYWVVMLGQVGMIGLWAFLWIIWKFYKVGFNVYKNSNDLLKKGIALGFLGVTVGVFFYDFITPALETRPLAFYFWLFAGLIGNWSKSIPGNEI
jgi:hypothetical protein